MHMKKILIPVDGSDFSLEVAPYIIRFLKPQDTEIVLLHVAVEPTVIELGEPGAPELTAYVDQEEASIESGFATAMQPHVRQLTRAGFTVNTAVRYGEPTYEIERFIEDEHIGMVAMATHGRTGLARVLLGSVAQHILNHAAVPVLLHRALVTREHSPVDNPVLDNPVLDNPAERLAMRTWLPH